MMRARLYVGRAFVALAALLCTFLVAGQERAEAVTGSDFDPGNIISDEVFFSSNAMSQADIQGFLDGKIGACGNSLCLNVLRVDTPTVPTQDYCNGYAGGQGETAAAIIFKVQQSCGISAKVILVTLQKEQGLVTRTSPSQEILRKAMGMGCPDTSVCDSQYYGFFNQVYAAARQLNRYNHGSFTWFKVGQYNNVLWHPDASCGSSPVLIRNKATAALYYYTPYQPNAAALANLGGTGDGCSSYGNRNFWVYFNDWFGSTQTEAGPAAIRASYAASGGPAGPLGGAVSGLISMPYYGGGLGQAFVGGSIYWTPGTGAHIVTGSILPYYFAIDGARGPLAWPDSDASSIPQNGGGVGQSFQYGSIYASASAGTWSVKGKMRQAYWAESGAAGGLGWPLGEQSSISQNGGGIGQEFQGGSIYAKNGGAAFFTGGPIRARYFALGGAAGVVGWPESKIVSTPQNGGGVGQAFSGGSIYSSPAGTWEVVGDIRAYYFALSGSLGQLGWPLNAQTCVGGTCTQDFQGGTISWSATLGARLISPAIEALYSSLGGQKGSLGASASGLIPIPQNGGGIGQIFAGGSIYWKSATGAHAVTGGVRDTYFANGGAAGALGWPTGDATCGRPDGGCSQAFENAWVYWSPSGGGWISRPEIEALYTSLGGQNGPLGRSASGLISIPQNGGGIGQVFQSGSIYTSAAGTWAVTGGIRDTYFTASGAAGPLGWPTAGAVCGSGGRCTQTFQGGTIAWSPTEAGRVL